MSSGQSIDLKNHVVLVTRPAHQASPFIKLLEAHGAKPLAFPVIEIVAVNVPDSAAILSSLQQYDMLIFTSVNAVNYARRQMPGLDVPPAEIQSSIVAIGEATSKALEAADIQVNIKPRRGFNSEALLAEPELQLQNLKDRKVLILKGEGGRNMLLNELQQRGAQVSTIDLYKRIKPQLDSGLERLHLSRNWHKLGINSITVTSNEALQNLYDMLVDTALQQMLQTTLVVPSSRCAELAQKLGFKTVCIAESALDQHMLEAIAACH